MGLQAAVGNRAVVQMLERDGRSGDAVQRSAVHDVLRTPGRPLDAAVRSEMEGRMGADFSAVRVHDDSAARASAAEVGARAYTSGNHVVIGEGGGDRHTLAHELTHVLQQRRGPVAGADNGSGLRVSDPSDRFEREAEANAVRVMRRALPGNGPAIAEPTEEHTDAHGSGPRAGEAVVQRAAAFTPFATTTPSSASLAGLQTDVLNGAGLVYPGGGTLGNSLYLERMLSNSGGGSSPGEPADFSVMKAADRNLVRANGQQNAATAMHAINGDFVAGANDTAWNIFLGSAKSNTNEHFTKVERPIRTAMQSGTTGLAAGYEQWIAANHPIDLGDKKIGFAAPGQHVQGAATSAAALKPYKDTHPTVTHVLDPAAPLNNPDARWPKLIHYRVTPHYTYSNDPAQWPQFLKDNLAAAQELVDEEQAKPAAQQDQQGLANELAAMDILKLRAHQLFPATYTCEADYYIASYDPRAPWHHGHDKETYDAEI
ncbi:eCIS core domain-containing protein [Kitasatospora xanthocidica]|uniref:eCIS core domain-containing protein n=1 Tax=Kitasatospora xanthocidica TaxID=83382 RepID=UPI003570FBDD